MRASEPSLYFCSVVIEAENGPFVGPKEISMPNSRRENVRSTMKILGKMGSLPRKHETGNARQIVAFSFL
jgi:hypothetical protein